MGLAIPSPRPFHIMDIHVNKERGSAIDGGPRGPKYGLDDSEPAAISHKESHVNKEREARPLAVGPRHPTYGLGYSEPAAISHKGESCK